MVIITENRSGILGEMNKKDEMDMMNDKGEMFDKVSHVGKSDMSLAHDMDFSLDRRMKRAQRRDELRVMVMSVGMPVSSPSKALECINKGYSIVVHGDNGRDIDCELLRRNARTRDNKTVIVKRMFRSDGSFDASEVSAADAVAYVASVVDNRRLSAIQSQGIMSGGGFDAMREDLGDGDGGEVVGDGENGEGGGGGSKHWDECLKRFNRRTLSVLETLPSRGGRVVV